MNCVWIIVLLEDPYLGCLRAIFDYIQCGVAIMVLCLCVFLMVLVVLYDFKKILISVFQCVLHIFIDLSLLLVSINSVTHR